MNRPISNIESIMDIHAVTAFILLLLGFACGAMDDPCFTFTGNGYLKFNLDGFINDGHAHYSLKFKTSSPHGVIMYSSGDHGDDEALFVREGKLIYHLFNQASTGVEGQFGGRYVGDVPINTEDEVEVHMYRSFEVADPVQRTTKEQTGLVYTVGGSTYTHVDFRPRTDISLNSEIYVGGFNGVLSSTVGNFTGQIAHIREEKNNALFRTFTTNAGGHVRSGCLNIGSN